MDDTPDNVREPDEGLRREISQFGFTAISLNGVIGAGIFALPAVALGAAGLFSPWLILMCALLILPVVLSFARAASFFSHTGGPLAYVGHAFGPFAAFQVGWLFALSRIAAAAANANVLVTYAAWFWEPLAVGWVKKLVVALILVLITVLNIIGVKRAMAAVFLFTLLKLIPLAVLILLGLSHLDPGIFTDAGLPVFDGLGETLLVLIYAYVGFEGTSVPAGEARNPRRDIPRALVLSVLAVAVIYVLVQIVVVSVTPGAEGSERPLIDVALVLLGGFGAGLVAFGAVASIFGNISSMMLSGPRLIYALGRERLLPGWFGEVHPGFGTPARAVAFTGALSVVLGVSGGFVWLAAMSTVVRLIVYSACILALPRLHSAAEPGQPTFRLPGGWPIPALGLVVSLWLIAQAPADSWWYTGVFVLVGAALYAATRSRG